MYTIIHIHILILEAHVYTRIYVPDARTASPVIWFMDKSSLYMYLRAPSALGRLSIWLLSKNNFCNNEILPTLGGISMNSLWLSTRHLRRILELLTLGRLERLFLESTIASSMGRSKMSMGSRLIQFLLATSFLRLTKSCAKLRGILVTRFCPMRRVRIVLYGPTEMYLSCDKYE